MFKQILSLFNSREKTQFVGLFFLMLTTGLVEMIGVGIIFPLMGILTDQQKIHQSSVLEFLYTKLGMSSERNFLVLMILCFLAVILFKNLFFGFSFFLQQTFLIKTRVKMINLLFQGYLRSSYEYHLNHNSTLLWRNMNMVDSVFTGLLQPFFAIVSEALIVFFIILMMLYTDFIVTLAAVIVIMLPSFVMHRFFGSWLKRIGTDNFKYVGLSSKILVEAFGGIKEILMMGRQNYFANEYVLKSKKLGFLRRDQAVMYLIPRLVLEPLIASSLLGGIMIILFFQEKSLATVLPLLALFSAAAMRLMPSITKIIAGLNSLNFNHVLEDSICKELIHFNEQLAHTEFMDHLQLPEKKEPFRSKIELNRVSFRYSNSEVNNIDDLSLTITKGESVAFTGPSGAGKSTLADLILGLLQPSKGTVKVDGVNLAVNLEKNHGLMGYIPQTIFLADDTLRRNIAFGISEHLVDDEAVMKAIELAQLFDVFEALPAGINTIIGEKGTRLSGGQRQRIGIARALYFDPDIIVMDEATSALDGETESEVSKAIEKLVGEKTIIIIAHRLSTVKKCNRVFYMVGGRINAVGRFEELLLDNSDFRNMAQSQLVQNVK